MSVVTMMNEYRYNSSFREYVDKYSKSRGCTVEEAMQHAIVRQVYLYYTEV